MKSLYFAPMGAVIPLVATAAAANCFAVVFNGTLRVIYVDAHASGSNTGDSWSDAFTNLQAALAAATTGDEIWVAAGTYTPGPPGDAVSSFQLRTGIALLGGFAGSETSREQRNWTTHVTVLSGDVGRDDIYGAGVWYQGWNRHTANSGHVVVGSGTDATAVLDGFTIMAGATGPDGTPAGSPLMVGSGLYNVGGNPTIRNCIFMRNLAAFGSGAAIYNYDSSPTVQGCTFAENYVHLGTGGGIYNAGNSTPIITDCVFSSNICVGSQPEAAGAGISNYFTPPITVDRCGFQSNVVTNSFGGLYPAYGGAIENLGTTLTVRNCWFAQNVANVGGAINTFDPLVVENSLFVGNVAGSYEVGGGLGIDGIGGAISSLDFQESETLIRNCTLVANQANEAGGVITANGHQTTIRNSILWGNVATGEEVAPRDAQYKGNTAVLYSCVQDLLTPVPGEDPPNPLDYPGSIDTNPAFLQTTAGNYRLSWESACINTGEPAFMLEEKDLDGLARVRCARVDMGAYESGAGDVSCDRVVGPADLASLAECMRGPAEARPSNCVEADFDGNGFVDLSDFDLLQRADQTP